MTRNQSSQSTPPARARGYLPGLGRFSKILSIHFLRLSSRRQDDQPHTTAADHRQQQQPQQQQQQQRDLSPPPFKRRTSIGSKFNLFSRKAQNPCKALSSEFLIQLIAGKGAAERLRMAEHTKALERSKANYKAREERENASKSASSSRSSISSNASQPATPTEAPGTNPTILVTGPPDVLPSTTGPSGTADPAIVSPTTGLPGAEASGTIHSGTVRPHKVPPTTATAEIDHRFLYPSFTLRPTDILPPKFAYPGYKPLGRVPAGARPPIIRPLETIDENAPSEPSRTVTLLEAFLPGTVQQETQPPTTEAPNTSKENAASTTERTGTRIQGPMVEVARAVKFPKRQRNINLFGLTHPTDTSECDTLSKLKYRYEPYRLPQETEEEKAARKKAEAEEKPLPLYPMLELPENEGFGRFRHAVSASELWKAERFGLIEPRPRPCLLGEPHQGMPNSDEEDDDEEMPFVMEILQLKPAAGKKAQNKGEKKVTNEDLRQEEITPEENETRKLTRWQHMMDQRAIHHFVSASLEDAEKNGYNFKSGVWHRLLDPNYKRFEGLMLPLPPIDKLPSEYPTENLMALRDRPRYDERENEEAVEDEEEEWETDEEEEGEE
ncbi:MAG: hypothetical protein M1816_005292 [Peltula sp. TS41687]|nr:MAG: hypothetical protein M1816_005292 [Peltula sp. TS41687]